MECRFFIRTLLEKLSQTSLYGEALYLLKKMVIDIDWSIILEVPAENQAAEEKI